MKEFIKIDASFWRSTIKRESADTRILFQAMIQLADKDGVLAESPFSLSETAGISLEAAKEGLERLQLADPESKSKKHEGRRVLDLGENTWRVVNYRKYIRPASERTEYQRNLMRQRRAALMLGKVSSVSTEVEVEKEVDKKKKPTLSVSRTKQTVYPDDFEVFWNHYPRPVGKKKALEAWIKTEYDRPILPELLAALKKRTVAWTNQGTEPDKIPHPTTWINQHRWLDEPMRGDL